MIERGITIVHDPGYANWVFSAHHPTQGRRFINGFREISARCQAQNRVLTVLPPISVDATTLQVVHTDEYIHEVVVAHRCAEWSDERADLSNLAQLFVGGTLVALDALIDGDARTAVHLPGAKHHAQADSSSGFCVFGDFAIAALRARQSGQRVAVLDIDAHHGDGTENLLRTYPDVLTYSIHQFGIFPGSGQAHDEAASAYNWPLDHGDGDDCLLDAVRDFLERCEEFSPTLIMVAAGADGLAEDPLTGLDYSIEGLARACALVRQAYPQTGILMGGAGGYLPEDGTPRAWAAMACALAGD